MQLHNYLGYLSIKNLYIVYGNQKIDTFYEFFIFIWFINLYSNYD